MIVEKYINPRFLPNRKPSWQKAYQYAKLMESGVKFPPVKIYFDEKGTMTYNDGIHRVAAAKMLGIKLLVKMKVKR